MTTVYLVAELPDGMVDRGDYPESVVLVTLDKEKAEKKLVELFAKFEMDADLEEKTLEHQDSYAEFCDYCFILEKEMV